MKQGTPEWIERTRTKNAQRRLRNRFGITLEERDAMLEKQGGVCNICGALPPADRFLNIDHDHATGDIRGLLCFSCNNLLGWYEKHQDKIHQHLGTTSIKQTELGS